jgi:hypothetical protein
MNHYALRLFVRSLITEAKKEDKDPKKTIKAIDNLKRHLAPGGILIITAPIGQNPFLDNYIFNDIFKFDKSFLFVMNCCIFQS